MNIEIANRLQKLRKENGYSQEELADKLGISRQAVSKWERAESSPDTDNLIILARLYNMSLDELLYDNETNDEIRERTMDKEEDKKDEIKADSNSISLTDDEGQTVKIEGGHVKFINPDGTEEKLNKKQTIALSIIDGVIFLLTLTGYFIWSFCFNAWYVSWVLWVAMPAIMSIFEAIFKKQLTKFVYPLLIAAVYCFIGMQYDLWHPFWILFITIPVYYMIADPIDKYVFKTKELDEDDKDED